MKHIHDYDEEDEGPEGRIDIPCSTLELSEFIEERISNIPDKRKKNIYRIWKEELNELIAECNKRANFVMYKLIK